MATKALNFKMDEADIEDIKKISSVFNMSQTEIVKNAIRQYINKLKKDPYYRLTSHVMEADPEETEEILRHLDSMNDDDFEIVASEHFEL